MEFKSPVCIFLPVILVMLCVDVAACQIILSLVTEGKKKISP